MNYDNDINKAVRAIHDYCRDTKCAECDFAIPARSYPCICGLVADKDRAYICPADWDLEALDV